MIYRKETNLKQNVKKNFETNDDGTKPLYFIYGNKFNPVVSKIAYLVGKSHRRRRKERRMNLAIGIKTLAKQLLSARFIRINTVYSGKNGCISQCVV